MYDLVHHIVLGESVTTEDFPALIRAIRAAHGLTQEQLARELDVTYGTVNSWENGKHTPIRALARRIRELAAAAKSDVKKKAPGRKRRSARRPK